MTLNLSSLTYRFIAGCILMTMILAHYTNAEVVGYWPFENGPKDVSGLSRGGTINGGVIHREKDAGSVGKYYSFNGSGEILADEPAAAKGSVNMSISFWMRSGYTGVSHIYRRRGSYADHTIRLNGGRIECHIYTVSSSYISSNRKVNDSNWHHISVTVSGSKMLKIYIDGELDRSVSVNGNINWENYIATCIGNGHDSGNHYVGDLDEFFLFDSVISHNFIKALSQGIKLHDFNNNSTPDALEDFNSNGAPDAFEDFNSNGTPDAFEDFNGNDTPDAFEDFNGNDTPDTFEDFNGNDTPDAFEDFNGNDTPDAFEDFNANGTPDAFEDFNDNGIANAFEDFNSDGRPDAFEDYNDNSIADVFEDYNSDGRPDAFEDYNENGIADTFEDFNENDIPDAFEDFNGNDMPDAFEDFSYNGKPDAFEDFNGNDTPDAFEDFNGNNIPDAFEDFGSNGKPDAFDDQNKNGRADAFEDFNGNDIPDAFEDFNNNGLPDLFENSNAFRTPLFVADFNTNGMPDIFEDVNRNGTPDFFEDFNGNAISEAFEDFNNNGTADVLESKGEAVPFDSTFETFGAMRIAVFDNSNPSAPILSDQSYSGTSFHLDWSSFLSGSAGSAGVIYRVGKAKDVLLELDDYDGFISRELAQGVDITLTENACYYIRVAPILLADASIDRENETVVRIMRESRRPFVRSPTHPDPNSAYLAQNVNLEFLPFHYDGNSVARFYYLWDQIASTEPTKKSPSLTAYNKAFIFQPDGTYYFHIRAEDHAGQLSDTAHFRVIIGTPASPSAEFVAMPTAGVAPLTVSFNDQSSGSITSRTWNFGDGSGNVENPGTTVSHTFADPGIYTVSLTASGPGGTDTVTKADLITVTRAPNQGPTAHVAQAQITLGSISEGVLLDASGSSDPDGDPLWYSWREDPRNPVVGLFPLTSESLSQVRLFFPKPGIYVFEVVVSDGQAVSDSNPDAPGAQGAYVTVYVPGISGTTYAFPSDDLIRLSDTEVGIFANATDAANWRNFLDLTIADSNGEFVLDSFGTGDVIVRRRRAGYIDAQDSRTINASGLEESYGLRRGQIAEFRGTVRRPDGSPAANVQVAAIAGFNVLGSPTTTDGNGNFTLANVWKGSWILQLMHSQGADVRDILVTEGIAPSVVLRSASGVGTVSGNVQLLGTEKPVAGATVELGFGGTYADETDSNGYYEIQNVPVGTYVCWVRKDGYEAERRLNVEVANGSNTEDFELTFEGTGPVFFGQIHDAENADLYVPNATVAVLDGSGQAVRSGVTDRTGFFQIVDMPQATQQIRVTAPGYEAKELELAIVSNLVGRLIALDRGPNWQAPELPEILPPKANLTASRSVLSYVGDSTQLTASAPGASGNLSYVWRESPDNPNTGGNIPAGAASLSQWTFTPTQPGIYTFELQIKVDGVLLPNTAAIQVSVPGLAGYVCLSPSAGIYPGVSVEVRAYTSYQDALNWNSNWTRAITSVERGEFAFQNLHAGVYWIAARDNADEFEPYGPVKRTVNHATSMNNIEINMTKPTYSVSGVIRDDVGDPLEGVSVIVAPGMRSEAFRTTTFTDGRYTLTDIPRGSHPFMLHKDGYAPLTQSQAVVGNTTSMNFVMTPAGGDTTTLRGKVTVDYNGIAMPLSHVEVQIGSGVARAFTDHNGDFEIAGLPPGWYSGIVRKNGFEPALLGGGSPFLFVTGAVKEQNYTLQFDGPGPALAGEVVDESGEPAEGVDILILPPRPIAASSVIMSSEPHATSDAGGRFNLTGVPHGVREVEFWRDGELLTTTTMNVTGNGRMVAVLPAPPPTYSVIFDLGDHGTHTGGGALSQTITHGEAAVAPEVTPDTGWVHTGWDVSFDAVTSNLTVAALYQEKTYSVTFVLGDKGSRTGGGMLMQTVTHGQAAVEPVVEGDTGWTFTGWDVAFDSITSSLTVTAEYEVTTYTVTFDLEDKGVRIGGGTLVQSVAHGQAAIAPVVDGHVGWEFTGWSESFANVTTSLTVRALYESVPPAWADPSGMANSMAVYAKVQVLPDETMIEAEGSLLAAFLGTDCRGVATIGEGPTGPTWTLQVFSNESSELGLTFQVWDAGTGEIYEVAQTFAFEQDANIGTIGEPEILSAGLVTQSLELVQNWNWISFNVLPESPSPDVVLGTSGWQDNDTIKGPGGIATFASGQWWGLAELNAGVRYLLKVQKPNPDALAVTGTPVALEPLNMVQGWNWLGYTPQGAMTVEQALASLTLVDNDTLKTPAGLSTYASGKWWGTLAEMKPGAGYLLKLSGASTLSYPGTPATTTANVIVADAETTESPGWEIPMGYANSMAIYAQVFDNGTPIEAADSLLAAFKGDELRGVSGLIDGPNGKLYNLQAFSNLANESGLTYRFYHAERDTIYDVTESLEFVDGGNVGTILAPASLTALIVPSVHVADASIVEGDAGTVKMHVPVTLSGPWAQQVSVDYLVTGKTATAGIDFTAANGTLNIPAQTTAANISISINSDIVDELDETLSITLSNPVNATLGASSATGTIVDDDTATLAIEDGQVTEGDVGTISLNLAVTLSTPSSKTVTADWSTQAGTATAGDDYISASGVLSISPGEIAGTITVTVNSDIVDELDETLIVALGKVQNAAQGNLQATGSIIDDDTSVLSIDDNSITEGDTGTQNLTFTVVLSAPSATTISVDWSTQDGTAEAGVDYTAASGTVSFQPGETEASILVSYQGDYLAEPDETFLLNLGQPVNAVGGALQAVGTIANDDAAPVAGSDSYQVSRNNTLSINEDHGVLANDSDLDTDDAITAHKLTDPAHGTVELETDGAFTYTPEAGFSGLDSFSYLAEDPHGNQSASTNVVIDVLLNDPPVANSRSYHGIENQLLSISAARSVLNNDSDPNGDTLQAALRQAPNQGSIVLDKNGSFTYEPDPGFVGTDSFSYTAHDGWTSSEPATVSLVIHASERAVQVGSTGGEAGEQMDLPIDFQAVGNEKKVSLSIWFDPDKYEYFVVGSTDVSAASWSVTYDTSMIDEGKLGITAEGDFSPGSHRLANVPMRLKNDAEDGADDIQIADEPVPAQILNESDEPIEGAGWFGGEVVTGEVTVLVYRLIIVGTTYDGGRERVRRMGTLRLEMVEDQIHQAIATFDDGTEAWHLESLKGLSFSDGRRDYLTWLTLPQPVLNENDQVTQYQLRILTGFYGFIPINRERVELPIMFRGYLQGNTGAGRTDARLIARLDRRATQAALETESTSARLQGFRSQPETYELRSTATGAILVYRLTRTGWRYINSNREREMYRGYLLHDTSTDELSAIVSWRDLNTRQNLYRVEDWNAPGTFLINNTYSDGRFDNANMGLLIPGDSDTPTELLVMDGPMRDMPVGNGDQLVPLRLRGMRFVLSNELSQEDRVMAFWDRRLTWDVNGDDLTLQQAIDHVIDARFSRRYEPAE